jgi:hypothetical protein
VTGTDAAAERVRAVADAVLYEGYLLYPYRSTSAKNQVRWQFGVLGPPGAAAAGVGEDPDLGVQCLLGPAAASARVRLYLRFLQLQVRHVERADGPESASTPVPELTVAGQTWLPWDEAAEHELALGPYPLVGGSVEEVTVGVPGGDHVEPLRDAGGRMVGRLVRRREAVSAAVRVEVRAAGPGVLRLCVDVRNGTPSARSIVDGRAGGPDRVRRADRDSATARSLLGAHLILVAEGAAFASVIDPPEWAREAAAGCVQRRCWPVLAGGTGDASDAGNTSDTVLASPIILYDHPQLAPESTGALFDSTEIDEILTLRVMTLTDDEKAAARATDPRAAAIIDRCDRLTPTELQRLHGILRDPRPGGAFAPYATERAAEPGADGVRTWTTPTDDVPWWDPAADRSVSPATDAVLVQGVEIRRDSLVRLRPNRRADAQDLFFADRAARVTAVFSDVDGGSHVAVVLLDDPAADLHEWYGRYLYFAPDELEPMAAEGVPAPAADTRRDVDHASHRSADHDAGLSGPAPRGGAGDPLDTGHPAVPADPPDVTAEATMAATADATRAGGRP